MRTGLQPVALPTELRFHKQTPHSILNAHLIKARNVPEVPYEEDKGIEPLGFHLVLA